MIEERVECKRLGKDYVDLLEQMVCILRQYPNTYYYLSDKGIDKIEDLSLNLATGKYEIIEFGTRKSPFDVTNALQEKDKEIQRLNNIIDIKTNRIQQLMKRLSKRQEKVDRLNNIINDKKERQDIAIRLLEKMFGTDDYEINYIIGVLNGQRQIHFEELEEGKK